MKKLIVAVAVVMVIAIAGVFLPAGKSVVQTVVGAFPSPTIYEALELLGFAGLHGCSLFGVWVTWLPSGWRHEVAPSVRLRVVADCWGRSPPQSRPTVPPLARRLPEDREPRRSGGRWPA